MSQPNAQRLAAGWFLGVILCAGAVFACLRGAGRFVLPLALLALLGYGVHRFVRIVRAPVD